MLKKLLRKGHGPASNKTIIEMVRQHHGALRVRARGHDVRLRGHWNTKHERYKTKEILVLDKIGRVSIKSLAAIVMWPGMLGDDLTRLECYVREKDLQIGGV
jgi:hypothetical protein